MNTPQQEDMEVRCARPNEMVERVALALLRATCENFGDPLPTTPDLSLTRVLARAAIEAMRVPTEAMCIAGEEAPMTYGDGHDPRDVWPRMIDAALSPAQRPSNPQQEERG